MSTIFSLAPIKASAFSLSSRNIDKEVNCIDLENLAVVDETIQALRKGRIRFKGSFWFARCEQDITLQPGELVRVINLDRSQITYIVKPLN